MTPTCARDGCPTPCTMELIVEVPCGMHHIKIAYACQLPHLTAVMFATRHLGEARRVQTLGGK